MHLPAELWLQVFTWIMESAPGEQLTENYTPFENVRIQLEGVHARITSRYLIALVCRQWCELVQSSPQFTEIRVLESKIHALDSVLRAGSNPTKHGGLNNGESVRLMVLPYDATQTSPASRPADGSTELVRLCPNLRVLIRPTPAYGQLHYLTTSLSFEFTAEDVPPLPSLRRLDWTYFDRAARTGGINTLHEVLMQAPNLKYLSLGGDMPFVRHPLVSLPALTTIRFLSLISILGVRQACTWSLPGVTHVILDGLMKKAGLAILWDTLADQLRIVELGVHMSFLAHDVLLSVLRRCRNLETLNYHIHFTRIPEAASQNDPDFPLFVSNIVHIGLHSLPNQSMDDQTIPHVEQHFHWLIDRTRFPSLQSIRLYGNWKAILEDSRFRRLEQLCNREGCDLLAERF
ncbi:hypothetical protein BDV98DRAFT_195276 [Pterulicium gracile]|uniref:F-box domain-containing protein n=1 Tax=Pterulicium gracile TaxID=1884261 RepID=A0A5C3QKC6_9AGAR|nr:hypothetical protein BDV98DRAFT_195276 [Pterula gracilis]